MDFYETVGHLGSALSSITFMPQVYQTWKSKTAKDLNIATLIIVFVSTIIWVVYGIGKNLWPVIICNSIICGLSVMLIYFKYRYRA
jgi:MtN3 and saliva related transmembrane protein